MHIIYIFAPIGAYFITGSDQVLKEFSPLGAHSFL